MTDWECFGGAFSEHNLIMVSEGIYIHILTGSLITRSVMQELLNILAKMYGIDRYHRAQTTIVCLPPDPDNLKESNQMTHFCRVDRACGLFCGH